jgi:hypothetical protein
MSRGCWNFIKRGVLSNIFFMLSDLDVECNDGMYFSPSEGNLTKNPEDYFKYQKRTRKTYGSSQSSAPFQCCILTETFCPIARSGVWIAASDDRDNNREAALCDGPSDTSPRDL